VSSGEEAVLSLSNVPQASRSELLTVRVDSGLAVYSIKKRNVPVIRRELLRGGSMKHGTRTKLSKCHDCAQGLLTASQSGFEYWDEEGEGRGFWFCRYCGSNHVKIALEDDAGIKKEEDSYGRDGLSNF
jgi:hypothetical protein